jgi:DNA phosphorothioation-dependent restriction protein DptH
MLTPVSDADLYEHLSQQLLPGIRAALDAAGPGQRLRVTTLPVPVMERLCEALQDRASYRAFVLAKDPAGIAWRASSTKLIELRNVLPEPLLVFIPPDLRTAAEDSLDIATFTELALRNVTDDLRAVLLEQLPEQLRKRVAAALEYIRIERILMNADEAVEYLLTVVKNGGTPEAAGAALHCFGLVPDLAAFNEAEVEKRLSRNWNSVRVLDEPGSPLARIQKLPLEPETIQKRLFVFLRGRKPNCRIWGRDIAQESTWSDLSFDRWKFAGDIEETAGVRLILEELDLPLQTPDQVGGSAQLRVLNLEDTKAALKVVFRSLPRPAEVPAWTHYRFQVLSTADGDPEVEWESNSYPKPAGKQKHVRRSVKAKDLQALEEGTYFVKVDAYDANGNLLTTVRELDPRNPDSRKENESDHFLVVRGDAEVEQPEARAVFTTSLIDAWASLSTRALGSKGTGEAPDLGKLHGRWTEPLRAPTRGDVHFALDHEDGGGHTIVVPGLLRKVEAEIIAHPDHLGLYRLNLAVAKLADVSVERREQGLGHAPELSSFLETREALFKAISEQHGRRAPAGVDVERSGLVETADLVELEPLVRSYVDAYVELASLPAGRGVTSVVCQLDVVELRWSPTQVDPGRGLLLAPTHPVRVAWHLQHARQLRGLIDTWRQQTEAPADLRSLVETYRRDVQVTHAPPVLFDSRGRGYVEQGPLTSHWSLFLPDAGASGAVIDVAASRDRARAQLGVRGSSSVAPSVGSLDLARRLFEYLQLHPYVEQLHLNVFNPGDATLIADALRQLEKERRAIVGEPPLRYVVRLLAPRAGVDLTGDALESLLDPVRQVGEDDEFTLASSNHLHPKLVFARNSIEEFLARPNEFGAHVSIMLEQFAVHSRVGRVDGLRRGSYVAGLLQEPEIQSDVSGGLFAWQKGLNPRAATIADDWERRLVRALSVGQHVQALGTLGSEEGAADVAPLLAMQLDARGQALLKQVHIASDWVLTVDRNLGLEFYDSPGAAKEAGYLLDFAPEYLQQDRLRLMLTTRSTHELEAIVRPAVESFGLKLPTDGEVVALEGLRSLSGRLALRFMSSATQSAEVVGLLLARWLLEEVGVLSDRIVVPLDAHRSWFTSGERSQQRADLLLVSLDPKSRTVFGKVVEVKLREELPAAARSKLYRKMREQSDNTVEVMRSLFDLDYYAKPRADRLLRAKELSTALAFYVRRAQRYRLLGDAEAKAALDFVQDLDAGYHFDFSSLGVVFERVASGAHVDEEEPGYVVHRFGRDVASRLVQNACDRFTRNDTSRSRDAIGSDVSPPSTPPAEGERSPDFDSFRDAVDRGSPSLSNMVPESQRSRSPARSNRPTGNAAPVDRPQTSAPVAPAANAEPAEGGASRVAGVASAPIVAASTGAAAAATDTKEPEPYVIKPEVPPQALSDSARPPVYSAAAKVIVPDVLVGSTELTSQYGILGKLSSASVGIDLNGCNTISLFGVQGFGKSYTLGVISEMATKAVAGINVLPAPLATVIFHYHKSDAYEPEYASAVLPNHKARELEALRQEYGANPAGLDDVVLLTPEAKIEQRTREFPNITVLPIKFSSGELGAESWKFLLGAYGNDSLYVRQMVQIMRQHRGGLTLDVFRLAIASSGLPATSRNLADTRITFAEPYIDDSASLGDLLRPGRTVIVDLRDEWIEKDEALGLFVVMLRIFAASKFEGRDFNKLVVFDEAHKYITESDLIGQVVETIREMRHQATSVVIASQDPLSVPRAVIELTSILLLHRMTSPAWLKHLKGAISALDGISEAHVAALKPGEALLWAQRSTDPRFTQRPQKITIRPRFTQHGGGTKTAVAGQTVR